MKPVEEVLRDLPRNYRETAMTLHARGKDEGMLAAAEEVGKLLAGTDDLVDLYNALVSWGKATREIHGEQE
jgi:hypothetical protein